MEIIAHRRNTIIELENTSREYGIEVDIRSNGQDLIIHHEPFKKGELFVQWLESYNHGTLILNVKEEGLEGHLIDMMNAKGITNYFFLDQSFPFLIKWSEASQKRCAVRISEFESISTVMMLKNIAQWVWVDCFSKFPLNKSEVDELKSKGFKLCVVSPELQGRSEDLEISEFVEMLAEKDIVIDAVCTKRPYIWDY